MFTAFSFPGIVPSLVPYLKSNVKCLRRVIIVGTTITLVVYIAWEMLVLGTVPVGGTWGLAASLVRGESATEGLRNALSNPMIIVAAEYFAFFAIVTSFLGMALGLFDFLADGLKIKIRKLRHNIGLGMLVIIPSLFFAIAYPRAFLEALDMSGGFGDAILSCALPILMVWIGRYYQERQGPYRIMGGKTLLVLSFLFSVLIFIVEAVGRIGNMAGAVLGDFR